MRVIAWEAGMEYPTNTYLGNSCKIPTKKATGLSPQSGFSNLEPYEDILDRKPQKVQGPDRFVKLLCL